MKKHEITEKSPSEDNKLEEKPSTKGSTVPLRELLPIIIDFNVSAVTGGEKHQTSPLSSANKEISSKSLLDEK